MLPGRGRDSIGFETEGWTEQTDCFAPFVRRGRVGAGVRIAPREADKLSLEELQRDSCAGENLVQRPDVGVRAGVDDDLQGGATAQTVSSQRRLAADWRGRGNRCDRIWIAGTSA